MKLTSSQELTNVARTVQRLYNHVMNVRQQDAGADRGSPVKGMFDFEYFNQCLKEDFKDLIVGEKTVFPRYQISNGWGGCGSGGWEYKFEYELSSPEGLAWKAKVKAVVTNYSGSGYGGISESIESIDISCI